MHPVPINEAEGVIQRFYDPYRCHLKDWRFACDPGTNGKVRQNFHATSFSWDAGHGKTVIRLEKDVDLDVSMYDGLIACVSLTDTTCITITLVIDGREYVPINCTRGTNTSEEYEGPLAGKMISHIRITLTDDSSQPGNGHLFWLGVFNRQRREDRQARPNPFRDGWNDLLVSPGPLDVKPTLGLFFGATELDAIRKRAKTGPYRKLMDKLRKVADGERQKEPWRGVATHPNDKRPRCYRLRGPEPISQLAMQCGAFVGLIDNDPTLLRMAANHAMALCHCATWQPEFLPTLPGSSWEQRAFYEYRWAHNAIFAWDWAGCCLTEAGKHLLAQCLATKALPWILQTLMQHPYVRTCNQGVYIAWGAILCELALSSRYPYATELLDAAVKALDETVVAYFMPDGGTYEGVGYGTSTCGHALVAYQALARHQGVEFRTIVPPVLKQFNQYLVTMLSTVQPYGSTIKTADGGRAGVCVYEECLAGLHQLTGDPAMASLMAGMMVQEDDSRLHQACSPGALFNLIFGPDELPDPRAEPPVFSILNHTGMLCSCRPTEQGPVRLQLTGGMANTGHCHEDRGSIVLEAFGEEIAVERGQMGYDDPRCSTISYARYHNVLIPEFDDVLLSRQLNPCPAATIPEGEGDVVRMRASIDVTPAWGPRVKHVTRVVESDQPTSFRVTDAVESIQELRVSFNLHSSFPWVRTDAGWMTRGHKAVLTVHPLWKTDSESGAPDFIDGLKRPVYHLCLVAPPASRHRLQTILKVEPAVG